MALPVILVNSATGSDTAASGAGPATALTGSAGVTAADGLSVVLDGSPDLSGVATDGSHVLFMSDTNAGSKNFAKITGTANSGTPTATVTVSNAFQALNTDAWAIGGKRASIGSTTSTKLFSNNNTSGDALEGWIVEMESGHTETLAAAHIIRRPGNVTGGEITLRGTSGAATMPILTFSNNGNMIQVATTSGYISLKDFELRNSNATKTASIGLYLQIAPTTVKNVRINHATNRPWKGIKVEDSSIVRDCDVRNCAGIGIEINGQMPSEITNNIIKSNGSHGIADTSPSSSGTAVIEGNIIAANTGDGINVSATGAFVRPRVRIVHNTIDSNTGDGIEISSASTDLVAYSLQAIANNQITNNGGYACNFSGSSVTAILLKAHGANFRNNNHYNNSGLSNLTLVHDENTTNLDPSYVNAAADDYSIGTATKAKGYPLAGTLYVGKTSTTYSYVDPGAAARQEPAAGGLLVGNNRRNSTLSRR